MHSQPRGLHSLLEQQSETEGPFPPHEARCPSPSGRSPPAFFRIIPSTPYSSIFPLAASRSAQITLAPQQRTKRGKRRTPNSTVLCNALKRSTVRAGRDLRSPFSPRPTAGHSRGPPAHTAPGAAGSAPEADVQEAAARSPSRHPAPAAHRALPGDARTSSPSLLRKADTPVAHEGETRDRTEPRCIAALPRPRLGSEGSVQTYLEAAADGAERQQSTEWQRSSERRHAPPARCHALKVVKRASSDPLDRNPGSGQHLPAAERPSAPPLSTAPARGTARRRRPPPPHGRRGRDRDAAGAVRRSARPLGGRLSSAAPPNGCGSARLPRYLRPGTADPANGESTERGEMGGQVRGGASPTTAGGAREGAAFRAALLGGVAASPQPAPRCRRAHAVRVGC